MSSIPAQSTVVAIKEPGGPDMLVPELRQPRSPARARFWSRSPPPASTGRT